MILDEAIASNRRLISYHSHRLPSGTIKGIRLGIEALERLKDLREHEPQTVSTTWNKIFSKLPSETEG